MSDWPFDLLPVMIWIDWLGDDPVAPGVYLVAFHDDARDDEMSFEVGFSEGSDFTTSGGVFIPNVWAYARLR